MWEKRSLCRETVQHGRRCSRAVSLLWSQHIDTPGRHELWARKRYEAQLASLC